MNFLPSCSWYLLQIKPLWTLRPSPGTLVCLQQCLSACPCPGSLLRTISYNNTYRHLASLRKVIYLLTWLLDIHQGNTSWFSHLSTYFWFSTAFGEYQFPLQTLFFSACYIHQCVHKFYSLSASGNNVFPSAGSRFTGPLFPEALFKELHSIRQLPGFQKQSSFSKNSHIKPIVQLFHCCGFLEILSKSHLVLATCYYSFCLFGSRQNVQSSSIY